MRFFTIVIALLILASPGCVFAQSKTGTAIGQFLLIEPSARFAAMGNAGVSAAEGIQGAYYNPAAVGALDRRELMFTHSTWLADISYDYAALAIPVRSLGTFFAAVTSLNSGEMDVRTVEQPLGTGERFDAADLAFGLGYGRRITDRFDAGVQINYVDQRIWHSSLRTVTLNVGTLYRITEGGLRIGSSLVNYGTKAGFGGRDLRIQYDADTDIYGDNSSLPAEQHTEEYALPVLFRVGLLWPVRTGEEHRLLTAIDAFHPSDNTESVSMGAEWIWKEAFSARGGYQDLFQQDAEVGWTFGLGFRQVMETYGFDLDYAWADHGRLEDTHRVTFVVRF
ncbi:MAG: PorV/PorQ family protein [Candidatus Eisenbacteria bacterium]|nr:PorV/PorQ family protein [Candidatus Eisenbacteria bacterium]